MRAPQGDYAAIKFVWAERPVDCLVGFWHWCQCVANVPVRKWSVASILKIVGGPVGVCFHTCRTNCLLTDSEKISGLYCCQNIPRGKRKHCAWFLLPSPDCESDSFSALRVCPSLQEWYTLMLRECVLWIVDDCFFVPRWAAISRAGSYKCDLNFVGTPALLQPLKFCACAWCVRMTTNCGQVYNVDVCLVTVLLGIRHMLGHKVAVMFLYDLVSL